jgi:hypothetical protein
LSPSLLMRSYSCRMAKSVRFLMPYYILLILFKAFDLNRFFGILYKRLMRIILKIIQKIYGKVLLILINCKRMMSQ